jgi:hypothetical protein
MRLNVGHISRTEQKIDHLFEEVAAEVRPVLNGGCGRPGEISESFQIEKRMIVSFAYERKQVVERAPRWFVRTLSCVVFKNAYANGQ